MPVREWWACQPCPYYRTPLVPSGQGILGDGEKVLVDRKCQSVSHITNNHNNGLSFNICLPKGTNTLVPLLQSTITWQTYQLCVVWDLSKSYNVVHTTDQELHIGRLVWRSGEEEAEWKTFGFTRMHFGDNCAMCGLKVAKSKVADLGMSIDPEVVVIIKNTYINDGSGGGSKDTVD